MKNLLLTLLALPIFLSAQSPAELVMNNVWYLNDMYNECFWTEPGNPEEFGDIILSFQEAEEVTYFHSKICLTMDGTVELTDTEISFHNLLISGTPCQDPKNNEYEGGYICTLSHNFHYEIIMEADGSLTLKLQNEVFMGAVFSNRSLGTLEMNPEVGNVYPNPFKDIITVSNPKLKFDRITVTDLTGNRIYDTPAQEIKTQIDLRKYPSGVYIIRMTKKGVFAGSKKVIKK